MSRQQVIGINSGGQETQLFFSTVICRVLRELVTENVFSYKVCFTVTSAGCAFSVEWQLHACSYVVCLSGSDTVAAIVTSAAVLCFVGCCWPCSSVTHRCHAGISSSCRLVHTRPMPGFVLSFVVPRMQLGSTQLHHQCCLLSAT